LRNVNAWQVVTPRRSKFGLAINGHCFVAGRPAPPMPLWGDETMTTAKGQMDLFEDRVITLCEAAKIAGLGLITIKEALDQDELRVLKPPSGPIGIKLSDFNSWLESRAVVTSTKPTEFEDRDSPRGALEQAPLGTDQEPEDADV
jgi:hypothetical protein